jgi:hypothetical protein
MFSGGAHHRKITHTDKPISAGDAKGDEGKKNFAHQTITEAKGT